MAVSQASIIESLERACSDINQEEFIFSFLDAYGFPKSTITRLRNGDDVRNVGQGGDIGLKKKLYFRVVPVGQDVTAELEALKNSDLIARHDIRFVIVTDFETLVAFDRKADERLEVSLADLAKSYTFFLPLAGYEKAVMYSEHSADLKASEKMGQLFDLIQERNDLTKPEDIHALNVFLTRLLFCFYAEDTGIFAPDQMTSTLQACTQEDGSDVDQFFTDLFEVLNLEDGSAERQRMPQHFQEFRYVNGGLFNADEPVPEFGRKARRILLDCGALDWSEINPDIFGSMFQAVIDEEQRGNLGQHYTSVSNIMKVIQPLFLDPLYAELEKSRRNEKKLKELLLRLQNLRIFDPACGSGNFLIIAYKELRKLEMEIINALNALGRQSELYYSGIKLTQFYGIEIDDFACEIATLSLWLAEHQMNMAFKEKFGYAEAALPLKDGGNVVCGNSLRLDWKEVCPPMDEHGEPYEVYICGNPPFLGAKLLNASQRADVSVVFKDIKKAGLLDYVAAWYVKAARFMKNTNVRCAFVSTNSITQGEQVGVLWNWMLQQGMEIFFAHRTFPWSNEARSNAAVFCVIIGFSQGKTREKIIFEYDERRDRLHAISAKQINPYLVDAPFVLLNNRNKPLCDVPKIGIGNKPIDGGNYLFTAEGKNEFLQQEPLAGKFFKRWLGADEFTKGYYRYCLWLGDASSHELEKMPSVLKRIEAVRKYRLASKSLPTQRLAATPTRFHVENMPENNYLVIPKVSTVRRRYIPIGFESPDTLSSDLVFIIPNASLYHLGIIHSSMHNVWVNSVCGRLGSGYRYSGTLVYNNFPWPDASEAKRKHIETLAEEVLLIREDYPDKSLADLYDPEKMPAPLLAAHKALDRAVEALYRDRPFRDASERLEHLFNRYEKLIAQEQANVPAKKTRGRK